MLTNKKCFLTLYEAEEFSKIVNGKIMERTLPNYNFVEFVYVVYW